MSKGFKVIFSSLTLSLGLSFYPVYHCASLNLNQSQTSKPIESANILVPKSPYGNLLGRTQSLKLSTLRSVPCFGNVKWLDRISLAFTCISLTNNRLETWTDLVGFFWLVAIPLWLHWDAYLAVRLYEEKQRKWIKGILWTWKESANLQESYELMKCNWNTHKQI